jgi:inositol transport system permease protein
MMQVARGVALLITDGQNILQLKDYVVFGQGSIGPIPISILITIVITIIIWYVLRHTRLGRSLYAIGGNEEASVAAGINVKKNKYIVFIINGILVGIAGILFMSRVNAGLPNGAVGYEMEGLTAAIVGGTSFSGGVGSTMGTLAGAFIIGMLNNIMNLVGVDSYIQQIVKGAIIALAVIWDIRSKTKKTRKVILVEEKKAA